MADDRHPVVRVPPLPQLLPLSLQRVPVMEAGAVAVLRVAVVLMMLNAFFDTVANAEAAAAAVADRAGA